MVLEDDLSTPIFCEDEIENRTFNDNELDAPNGHGGIFCNPSSKCHRFIALILICLTGFSNNFCYDFPGALQNYFLRDMNMSTTQFALLYSIYAWPNVILCFIGGFLIDRVFGIRFGTIFFMFIVMIGQLIVAFGAILNAYWMMILGRLIFGIGAESLSVAQNNYCVRWFRGKELNMAFGMQLSSTCLGSTINFFVMEPIYKFVNQWYTGHLCLGVVMMIAFTTCLISFTCAVLLGVLDKRAERILQRNDNPGGKIAKLSDVKTFKASFWMVSMTCIASFMAMVPFINLGKMFFMQKYDFSAQNANIINSLVYTMKMVASPLFGCVIDKTGRNISWMVICVLVMITAHLFLAFTYVNPYVCMISMGLAYSMSGSSLWPLVPLTVPEYQLGTAYGIFLSLGNLGLAMASMFAGIIVDHRGYFTFEIFIISWLGITLIATMIVWVYDTNKNGNLNKTPHEREVYSALATSNTNDEQQNNE